MSWRHFQSLLDFERKTNNFKIIFLTPMVFQWTLSCNILYGCQVLKPVFNAAPPPTPIFLFLLSPFPGSSLLLFSLSLFLYLSLSLSLSALLVILSPFYSPLSPVLSLSLPFFLFVFISPLYPFPLYPFPPFFSY